MRTIKDRLRHTITFELIALGILMTAGSWITGHDMASIGAFGLMMSLIAMAWNLLFNWLFDIWDLQYRDMAPRGALIRVLHATLFEAVLLIVGLFLAAWWLELSYWDAFMLDIGISVFFLVYAYIFNWTYDIIFPISRHTKNSDVQAGQGNRVSEGL